MFAPHTCPTCSDRLLRHIGNQGLYWRCSNCRENFAPNHPSLGAEVKRNEILGLSPLGHFQAAVLS